LIAAEESQSVELSINQREYHFTLFSFSGDLFP